MNEFRREPRSINYIGIVQGDDSANKVRQFPNITGPVMTKEPVHEIRVELWRWLAYLCAELAGKVMSQQRNIFTPLA
jgi:hypothetical protein